MRPTPVLHASERRCAIDDPLFAIRRVSWIVIFLDLNFSILTSNLSRESLETFVQDNDRIVFGVETHSTEASDDIALHPHRRDPSCLLNLHDLVNVHVFNSFGTVLGLHRHLRTLDLLDPSKLRPGWDAYFMVTDFLLLYQLTHWCSYSC